MRKLRYAMVGGGRDAFIGAVHRKAMALDGQIEFIAGALSSDPEKARASGRDLGLADARNHGRWQDLLEDELKRPVGERIDFVSIVTPNHMHYPVALAFAEAGINVVCDKPLVHTSAQAEDLQRAAKTSGSVFAVTYNYTGYPMVRQARHMVKSGALGEIRKVIVEYNQGWLATQLEGTGNKQADWRTDPSKSGIAGAIGDIGSHAENLAATITGLEIDAICADLTTFVPGRRLDDDGNLLLRYTNGARGVLIASQIEIGCENDLRIRVFGTQGSLTWHQEEPNRLIHCPLGDSPRILTRGSANLCAAAVKATRLPAGHPEAFLEAFANIYLGASEAIRARSEERAPGDNEGDFPTLADGARGVRFIELTVAAAHSNEKWTRWS
jgi:predicted dehydrogenase